MSIEALRATEPKTTASVGVGKLRGIEGLRGIAVLMVIAHHAQVSFATGGYIGVEVFFVISGFVITKVVIERSKENKPWVKNFYWNRLVRLAPPLCFLLVAVLLGTFFFERSRFSQMLEASIYSLFYLANWAPIFDWVRLYKLDHLWSLGVEEQFYILYPLLFLVGLRLGPAKKVVVYVAIALILLYLWRAHLLIDGASPMRLYIGTDTRSMALVFGCGLAVYRYKNNAISVPANNTFVSCAIVVSFVILGTAFYYPYWKSSWVYIIWLPSVSLAASTLIYLSSFHARYILIDQLLCSKLLVYTGKISYGLYLYHFPIVRTMRNHEIDPLVMLVVGGIVSTILASLSYRFIEKPLLKYKR